MRDILFKGKRLDNGEWVKGYLWLGNNNKFITPYSVGVVYDDTHRRIRAFAVEVDPATIGQFTGARGKSDKVIYEGDIVTFGSAGATRTGKVVFNQKTCGFEVWYETIVGAYGEKATHKVNFANLENLEVIGNIHDNPELLEGGTA